MPLCNFYAYFHVFSPAINIQLFSYFIYLFICFVSGHALLQEAYDLGASEEHPPQALVFTPQDSYRYPIQT
jgi:hypothetical protein